MVSRQILAFSCAFVVEVIGATVIGTSKSFGEKFKTKLLVESKYCCFIKCILSLFDN
jgi:hypothetical protein